MLKAFNLEPPFRVAKAETITSYWYNGRLQIELLASLSRGDPNPTLL
jgi:hypothetical protein